jgi:predicted RNA-binding protein associated with RNAse of E/G family
MKFKNFNIKASNQAAKSRLKDNNIKKEWKETECIYLVPLNNFEKYIDDKTTNILDYKGNKIPPLSFRWIKFLKNKKNFNIIKQYANNKNITEWDITSIQKQNNTLGLNSYGFIWNNQDLKNSN